MSEYTINMDGGINLVFELDSYSPGEAACHDCPGEAEAFEFSYKFEVEPIHYLDDLCELKSGIDKIIEGDDIQDLMEAEYKKHNQPEPNH